MNPVFSTKKLKQTPGLGEALKTARKKKEISIAEAELATKVRARYLTALERGEWGKLPSTAYTRGFVLAYARFLELDLTEITNLFEREAIIYRDVEPRELSYSRPVKESKINITPKTLVYCGLGIFVLTMFSYIIYQVLGFAGSPDLAITKPENNVTVENDVIDLAGVTNADAYVTVNKEQVPVTSDGHFSLIYKLHRGVNVIEVRAFNKAKKESAEVYTVEYRPKTAEAAASDGNF